MVDRRNRENLISFAKVFYIYGFGNLIILLFDIYILISKSWSEQINMFINLTTIFTALASISLWLFILVKVRPYHNKNEKFILKLLGYIIILYYFINCFFSFLYKNFYINIVQFYDNASTKSNLLNEISTNMNQMIFELQIFLFLLVLVALFLFLHKDRFFWIGAAIVIAYFILSSLPEEIAKVYIDQSSSFMIQVDALFSKLINSLGYIAIGIYLNIAKIEIDDN